MAMAPQRGTIRVGSRCGSTPFCQEPVPCIPPVVTRQTPWITGVLRRTDTLACRLPRQMRSRFTMPSPASFTARPRGLTQALGVVCTGPDRPQRVGPAGLPAPGGLPPAHRRGHPSSARPCADIGPIRFIHYLHGDQESCRWSLAGGSSTLYIVLGNESSMQEFHGQAARNLPPNLNASRWLTPKSVQLAQQNPQAAPLQHKRVGRAVYAMDR